MSKITNDGLTRSGRGCFIAVLIRQQWVSTGLIIVTANTHAAGLFAVLSADIHRGNGAVTTTNGHPPLPTDCFTAARLSIFTRYSTICLWGVHGKHHLSSWHALT